MGETVGVTELRRNLGAYVRRASEGERLLITNRRRPVVELAFSEAGDWYVRPLPAPEYGQEDLRPTKAERDALLARLWREGRPERDIAEALDLKIGAVGSYVRELRDAQVDLPYRRPPRRPAERAARRRRDPRCVASS